MFVPSLQSARRRIIGSGLMILALAGISAPAGAATNLIVNGDFLHTTLTQSEDFNNYYTSGVDAVTGWNGGTTPTVGYNFLYMATTGATAAQNAMSPGALSQEYSNYTALWAVTNPVNGGNFIGADGAYQVGPVTQTVKGLTVGDVYRLTFDWAGAQQKGYDGATQEQWKVSFGGGAVQSTALVNDATHGFTGWMSESMTFTASATSEQLSFTPYGLPTGKPPFSLLSNVQLYDTTVTSNQSAVPEPASLLLIGVGLIAVAGVRRQRSGAA